MDFIFEWRISMNAHSNHTEVTYEEPPVQISPLNTSSGLLFEKMGKLHIYSHNWNIMTNVNLSLYQLEHYELESTIKHLVNCCANIKSTLSHIYDFKNGCGETLHEIKTLVQDIQLFSLETFLNIQIRNKRDTYERWQPIGLLRIGLSTYKNAKDFLENADKKMFIKQFEQINEMNKQRDTISKKQISFIQSIINYQENDTQTLFQHIQNLRKNIVHMNEQINVFYSNTNLKIEILNLKSSILESFALALHILTNFKNKQRLIHTHQ